MNALQFSNNLLKYIELFSQVILRHLDGNMTGTIRGNPKREFSSGCSDDFCDPEDECCSYPKQESIDFDPHNGVMYEITVSPAAQFYTADPGERTITIVDEWTKQLHHFFDGVADFKFIVETSYPKYLRFTPGKRSRVHFHGTIKFSNIAYFLNEQSHYLGDLCTFKISEYRPDVWSAYLEKQRYLMQPFLGDRYVITNRTPPPSPTSVGNSVTVKQCNSFQSNSAKTPRVSVPPYDTVAGQLSSSSIGVASNCAPRRRAEQRTSGRR